jgi:hypothetical protein
MDNNEFLSILSDGKNCVKKNRTSAHFCMMIVNGYPTCRSDVSIHDALRESQRALQYHMQKYRNSDFGVGAILPIGRLLFPETHESILER